MEFRKEQWFWNKSNSDKRIFLENWFPKMESVNIKKDSGETCWALIITIKINMTEKDVHN